MLPFDHNTPVVARRQLVTAIASLTYLVAVANIPLVVVASVVARHQLLFGIFKEVATSCLLSRGIKQNLGTLF